MEQVKLYKVMQWVFLAGEDQIVKDNLSKEEADEICKELNDINGDSNYSGYYVEQRS